jgi:hypothetical protein
VAECARHLHLQSVQSADPISSLPCDSDNLATPCRKLKLVAPWPPPWGICECPLPPPMPLPSSPAAFVSCFSLPEERDQEGAVSSAECGAWSAEERSLRTERMARPWAHQHLPEAQHQHRCALCAVALPACCLLSSPFFQARRGSGAATCRSRRGSRMPAPRRPRAVPSPPPTAPCTAGRHR